MFWSKKNVYPFHYRSKKVGFGVCFPNVMTVLDVYISPGLIKKIACTTQKYFFFFNSALRPFQDYFSSYETGQSVGGAKMGESREKPPGTPASRTWLVSHVARAGLEPTPDTAVR